MNSPQQILHALQSAYCRFDRMLLLFDYDGTLVPFAPHPRMAVLPPPARRLLAQLAKRQKIHIGVISARTIDDLKKMIRVWRLCYAGSSGLEVETYGTHFIHPQAAVAASMMTEVAARCEDQVRAYRGAWVEWKRVALTVHYRAVDKGRTRELRRRVKDVVTSQGTRLRMVNGPMAIEILPNLGWDKAAAMRLIRESLQVAGPATFFAGDGDNDTEALGAVMALGGTAIGIGKNCPTLGQPCLPTPSDLLEVLDDFCRALQQHEQSARYREALLDG